MPRKAVEVAHPAFALMRHAARDYLTRFETDLTHHDARSLAEHPHHEPFSWILTEQSTHLAWPCDPQGNSRKYGRMVADAMGVEHCRFFWWDGYRLQQMPSASDLDAQMRDYENVRKLGHAPGFAGEF